MNSATALQLGSCRRGLRRTAPLLAPLVFALLSTGCGPAREAAEGEFGETPLQQSRDHLEVAGDFINRFDEFEPGLAAQSILYHLNRWVADQPGARGWRPDPLLAKLPSQFRGHESLESLDRDRFDLDDLAYLHALTACRRLAWVAEEPLQDLRVRRWLEGPAAETLSPAERETLARACRLFDWSVRNLQLEESPAAQQGTVGPRRPGSEQEPTQLLDGPGLRRDLWLTLMTGHGDAWERARVFLALCRQHEIEALVLAVDRGNPLPEPWCVAVRLEEKLFLFDPHLGLPLEGAAAGSLLTLGELRAEPELLRAHDAGSFTYPLRAADLNRLVLLVDAEPPALSWRMERLAAALPARFELALAVSPTAIAEACRGAGVDLPVSVWTVPLEAVRRRRQVLQDPAERARFVAEQFWFLERTPLSQARWLHFGGVFEDGQRAGAMRRYLQSRVPEESIRQLTFAEFQATFGEQLARTAEETQREAFEAYKRSIRRTKQHASYWLGLLQYDRGEYAVAAEWLENRTLNPPGESPWRPGARYNLARAHEAREQWSRARQLYLGDESPQAHGNQVRAKRLRSLSEAAP